MSTFKYIYQTMLNYDRKSTEGFSIENVVLDFMGGLLSLIVVIIKKYGKHGKIIITFYLERGLIVFRFERFPGYKACQVLSFYCGDIF